MKKQSCFCQNTLQVHMPAALPTNGMQFLEEPSLNGCQERDAAGLLRHSSHHILRCAGWAGLTAKGVPRCS